jgi:hypothetical protein
MVKSCQKKNELAAYYRALKTPPPLSPMQLKETILATPTLRNNFTNAVGHISTAMQLSQSL